MRLRNLLPPQLRYAILAFFLPALILAACDQSPSERAREYLTAAQEFYKKGDFRAALVELKNAVKEDPENAAARQVLGSTHYHLGDYASAEKELAQAQKLGLQSPELSLLLAQTRLGREAYAQVVDDTPAEADLSSPVLRDLLVARGEALVGMGRLLEAERQFQQVLEAGPQANTYAGLARVAFAQHDYEKALSLLQRAMELSPDDPVYHAMAGGLYAALEQTGRAIGEFQQTLETDPGNYPATVGLAQLRIAQRDFEAADKLIDSGMQKSSQSVTLMVLKGYVALALKQYEVADQWSRRVLAYDAENLTALYVSGATAFARNELERAHSHLTQYLEKAPNDSSARSLLIQTSDRIASKAGENDAAEASELVVQNVSYEALDAGAAQASERSLAVLAAQEPGNPSVRARLSIAKSAAGDMRQARKELAQAIQLDTDGQYQNDLDRAETALVLSHLRQQNYTAATEAALAFQKRRPELATPYSLLAMINLAQEQTSKARNTLEDGLRRFPGSIELLGNLSALELRAGNLNAAIDASKRLISANGEHFPTLVRLATLSLRAGDREAAKSWAQRAIQANPDAIEPRVFLGKILLAENKYEEALGAVTDAEGAAHREPQLLEVAGQAQLGLGQSDHAIETLKQLVDLQPDSADAHYFLARAYGYGNKPKEMVENFDKALATDSKHYGTLLAYSRYLMQQHDVDGAEVLVKRLEEDSDGNPEITKLSGELALLRQDYDGAIEKFTEAQQALAKGGVFDQSIAANLSNAYWENGDTEDAVRVLQEWLVRSTDDSLVRLKLASRFSALGQKEKAADEFARVIAGDPKNWIARNEYALLLMAGGSYEAAKAQAESAVEYSDRNPLVMDTLGVVLLASDDAQGATEVLQQAHAKSPSAPEIGLHLSQALAKSGDREAARQVLDRFLKQDGAFAARDEMEQLYEGLK